MKALNSVSCLKAPRTRDIARAVIVEGHRCVSPLPQMLSHFRKGSRAQNLRAIDLQSAELHPNRKKKSHQAASFDFRIGYTKQPDMSFRASVLMAQMPNVRPAGTPECISSPDARVKSPWADLAYVRQRARSRAREGVTGGPPIKTAGPRSAREHRRAVVPGSLEPGGHSHHCLVDSLTRSILWTLNSESPLFCAFAKCPKMQTTRVSPIGPFIGVQQIM